MKFAVDLSDEQESALEALDVGEYEVLLIVQEEGSDPPGATDLASVPGASSVVITSSTGTDATIATAGATAGVMSAAQAATLAAAASATALASEASTRADADAALSTAISSLDAAAVGAAAVANNLSDLASGATALTNLHTAYGHVGVPIDSTSADILENKVYVPRVRNQASSASLTPSPSYGLWGCTALATNTTINAPSGSPVAGQPLILRFRDNGSPRTLTWNSAYVAVDEALPTTTVANQWVYVFLRWNATDTLWYVEDVLPRAAQGTGSMVRATGLVAYAAPIATTWTNITMDSVVGPGRYTTTGVTTAVARLSEGMVQLAGRISVTSGGITNGDHLCTLPAAVMTGATVTRRAVIHNSSGNAALVNITSAGVVTYASATAGAATFMDLDGATFRVV